MILLRLQGNAAATGTTDKQAAEYEVAHERAMIRQQKVCQSKLVFQE
jgi:hypothetical protein